MAVLAAADTLVAALVDTRNQTPWVAEAAVLDLLILLTLEMNRIFKGILKFQQEHLLLVILEEISLMVEMLLEREEMDMLQLLEME